ncbi:MerR family transcriptional regulator [Myxococcus sp. CA051A]|uniref:MerR family transcriptional regulator n=1 Tax=Myxococcus llanfairpwllgwyngyllgogerychwyrndrobwllllantysiliogogogochensis TaxID=2590453 RepID=A0A540X9R7_9BACT|nr:MULTISPECIES: MerR family transcriptional regulator [Myxococcus]NTX04448.1 MerR family transcriptional regulator [Myxococcus sp. CA040A]NTX17020.1 MerR family transcriptional regulator [Myxococcus sp. CA056]NTX35805.1 MerR family transcriptional regulator [Myxococcus sp. CA033]NTX50127.1 MerR family transcriptional regulator [Myxococcus sp. CA039A]NTX63534.1 MerR family transcriptional regulator [Myxococcus sp. CA051A]
MNIGELARRTGCSARSIRHYEKTGLLRSNRRANGYRDFDGESVPRVMQVAHLIRLGFSLGDIATFPPCMLRDVTHAICPQALALHRKRLAEFDQQLLELAGRRDRLARALGANARSTK